MSKQQGSSKTGILFGVSAVVFVAVLCGYCFWPSSDDDQIAGTSEIDVTDNNSGHGTGSLRGNRGASAEYVMVGGVRRKASDVRPAKRENDPLSQSGKASGKASGKRNPYDYGTLPHVAIDANPNVKSVAEALQKRNHPERLSPLVPSTPFDPKAYAKDPQAYLDVVEPGRVFAPAAPGKDVPRILPLCPRFQEVKQGKSVKLQVTGQPGMPVTFTSFDTGQFSNQLTSISVKVNDQGIAETEFFATSGTIEDVRIMAASPATSGQIRFIVNIQMPE